MKRTLLNYHTPDTVAECFGVSPELNTHLWNDILPQVKVEVFKEEGYTKCSKWSHLVDSKFHKEIKALEY